MRKRIVSVFLIALSLLMAFCFSSCGDEEFTVTFNGNGGSLVSGSETLTVEKGESVTPPLYERAGYTLSWGDFSFDEITESVTLKAVWTPIVYTITYALDGGTNHAENPNMYTVESEEITLQAPTKANRVFAGFSEGNTIPAKSTGNKTFTAIWTAAQYTYTFFDEDGTTVLKTATADYGSEIVPPTNPTKAVTSQYTYTFSGWDKEIPASLTANISFTASYSQTVNQYTYTFFDEDGITVLRTATEDYGSEIVPPPNPTKAATAQYTYTFSGWDKEIPSALEENITYMAIYSQTVNRYTYTFFDEDGTTVLKTATADYGSEIVPPTNPTKAATAQYTYTFSGWDKEIPSALEENITYMAIYSQTVNRYTYTFFDEDGITLLKTATEDYGSEIVPPTNPTKAATVQYSYTFSGWDKEIPSALTENITFTANYSETVNQYTYTFYDDDGITVLKTSTVDYGSEIAPPTNPTKVTAQYTYTFSGWDKEIPASLTANIFFTASYSQTVNQYTFTFFDEDGITVLKTATEDYGSEIVPPPNPTKAATAQYTYTFSGWDKEIPSALEENISYMAIYSQMVNQYTYTFYDEDGTTVLKNATEDYGWEIVPPTDPTKAATEEYTYTFSGWDKDIPETLTENITFTANYSETVNQYTYTFFDEDETTVLKTAMADYGSEIVPPTDPTKAATAEYTYTFCGWDKDIPETLTENITFTPTYTQMVNTYTYTFFDEDGTTVLKTEMTDYGSEIVPPPNPTKATTAEYTYTFSGWDKEIPSALEENITFTAQYTKTPIEYTITFDSNGGSSIEPVVLAFDTDISIPNPLRTRHTFAGWYMDNGTFIISCPDKMPAEDITLYTKWAPKENIVSFDANGGSGNMPAQMINVGSTAALNSNTFTKTDSYFSGWGTITWGVVEYADRAVYCMGLESIKLYAIWVPCTDISQFVFEPFGEDAYNLKQYNGTYADVAIPEEYNGKPVVGILSSAFYSNTTIQTVILPNSITTIGNIAFQNCNGLTSLSLPEGLISIGQQAFADCNNIVDLYLPSTLTTIGYKAFANCTGIKSINIPDSVTSLGENSFELTGATSVSIGSGVSNIPDGVFASDYSLSIVTVNRIEPPSLVWAAFYNCPLTAIYVPMGSENTYKTTSDWNNNAYIDKIFALGSSDFTVQFDSLGGSSILSIEAPMGCKITAPVSPLSQGKTFAGWYKEAEYLTLWDFDADNVFGNKILYAKWLINVIFDSLGGNDMPSLSVESGSLISHPGYTFKPGYYFQGWYKEADYINQWLFGEDTVITGITLYAKWTLSPGTEELIYILINGDTEYQVTGYEGSSSDIIIPLFYNDLPVTSIGEEVFRENTAIQTLIINGNIEIERKAFYLCTNLVNVYLGNNLTSIGYGAFDSCHALEYVVIPLSVTTIAADAFYDDSGKTITIHCEAASKPEGWNQFWEPTNAVVFWCSNGTESTYSFETFGGTVVAPITGYNVWSVPISEKDGYYFNGWYDNIDLLGLPVVFPYFSDIKQALYAGWLIEQSGGPATVGLVFELATEGTKYHVAGYTGTSETVFIPSIYNGLPVTEIKYYAFGNNNYITGVTIGNGIGRIGNDAFINCPLLESVVIGTGVTWIGTNAFDRCTSLASIIIPEGVEIINESVFSGCTLLASVIIPSTVTRIENFAFDKCPLAIVVIPRGVTYIGYMAFNCPGLSSVTVEAETPPTLYIHNPAIFGNTQSLHIYVLESSVAAYKAAPGWSTLADLISAIP